MLVQKHSCTCDLYQYRQSVDYEENQQIAKENSRMQNESADCGTANQQYYTLRV